MRQKSAMAWTGVSSKVESSMINVILDATGLSSLRDFACQPESLHFSVERRRHPSPFQLHRRK
jgi:hypothetical protein